jgi:hypothetical protein
VPLRNGEARENATVLLRRGLNPVRLGEWSLIRFYPRHDAPGGPGRGRKGPARRTLYLIGGPGDFSRKPLAT